MNISEKDVLRKDKYLPGRLEVQLLSSPLPIDLPTVQKDLLILMAAYNGDIDRYVRLRRPVRDYVEEYVVCRGILQHTFFALWWKSQPDISSKIQEAINARMIMNNVLDGAPYDEASTPYNIWHPVPAIESTYAQLVRIQPNMILQIMEAVIFADYRNLFDELLPGIVPHSDMLFQAGLKKDKYYEKALTERLETLGIDPEEWNPKRWNMWSDYCRVQNSMVATHLDTRSLSMSFAQLYPRRFCSAGDIEFNACLPEAWRTMMTHKGWGTDISYEEWPLSVLRGSLQPPR